MEMQKIDTISVVIEQSIADNEDSKGPLSGGDPIDHSDEAKVIILKLNLSRKCHFSLPSKVKSGTFYL